MNEKSIQVSQPKPYQKVGIRFLISGWVSVDWLETDYGRSYRIFLDHFNVNGTRFMGTTILLQPPKFFPRLRKRVRFTTAVHYDQIDMGWILQSKGLMAIKLKGHKENQELFIPIIVTGLPTDGEVDARLISLHSNMEQRIKRFDKELDQYFQEMDQLDQTRREATNTDDVPEGGFEIEDEELRRSLLEVIRSVGDEAKQALTEKYKEMLEWAGPNAMRFGAGVGRLNGFIFSVYGNDHEPKHFHAIHRERGINARFSFPDLELINYKQTGNFIGKKEAEAIRAYFQDNDRLKKLEAEFAKADEHNKNRAL